MAIDLSDLSKNKKRNNDAPHFFGRQSGAGSLLDLIVNKNVEVVNKDRTLRPWESFDQFKQCDKLLYMKCKKIEKITKIFIKDTKKVNSLSKHLKDRAKRLFGNSKD